MSKSTLSKTYAFWEFYTISVKQTLCFSMSLTQARVGLVGGNLIILLSLNMVTPNEIIIATFFILSQHRSPRQSFYQIEFWKKEFLMVVFSPATYFVGHNLFPNSISNDFCNSNVSFAESEQTVSLQLDESDDVISLFQKAKWFRKLGHVRWIQKVQLFNSIQLQTYGL